MTALQKVNLGTAPSGSDGDPVRTAFVKDNANVDVLNSQTFLTSATLITTAQALTTAHIGKRVNINLSTTGTINLPAASTCAVDQVTLLRNTGTTVVTLAITTGSGDNVSVSKLNPGEAALMDTDGVHTWACLMRGRTNSDNETVNGNCTVGGSETVGGPLTVGYSNPTLTVNDTSGVNAAQVFLQSAASTIWGISKTSPGAANKFQIQRYNAGALVDSPFTIDNATGVASFAQRPTFATKTPWDNGNLVSPWSTANLANPATTDTTQTLAGAKTFSAATQFNGYGNFAAPFVGTYLTSTINLSSSSTVCGFGFNAGGFGATFRLAGSNSPAFQFMDFQASTFIPIVCSTVTQTSDEALKTDIAPVSGVLQKLRNKRTVSYTFKRDDNKTRHVGVIAQEWQSDFPELVVDAGVDIDADGDFIAHQYDASGNEIFGPSGKPESRRALGFNYGNASAVALQGVIELQAALDLALARIAALEAAAK